MYQLHTDKQQKYFKEVIRLHYEEGYGENRIARIIPIWHTTAARWIAIFAREKGKIKGMADMAKTQKATSVETDSKDVKELYTTDNGFTLMKSRSFWFVSIHWDSMPQ